MEKPVRFNIIKHMNQIPHLLQHIEGSNGTNCLKLYADNKDLFIRAKGSSHNHQAWPGGYIDHLNQLENIAQILFALFIFDSVLFTFSDACLILFLHDLEKPWKSKMKFKTKAERHSFRLELIKKYKIKLTKYQLNALKYVEGEGDDYSPKKRVMNELAAFCHMCDVASARIFYNLPLPADRTIPSKTRRKKR